MPRRATRTTEARESTTRRAQARVTPQAGYQGRLYIDPLKIPKGFTYAWKRSHARNQPDPDNMRLNLQRGWRPVPADRHPEWSPPSMKAIFGDQFEAPSVITNGGLILCERDTRSVKMDQDKLAQENMQRIMGVNWADNGVQEDHRMPMKDFGSRTSIERVTEFKGDSE